MAKEEEIREVLKEAKSVARKYKKLTGRPLGITGEVAEVTAASLLGLELAEARQSGYDAIRVENEKEKKIQIKGRCLPAKFNPGARIGSIKIDKEWDSVVLVIMDEDFNPLEIYEAEGDAVVNALREPGSKARNERGQLSISKFKSIGTKIWPK
ncbi:MAG: hypothetical protein GXP42_01150 [Chloroflexi bacterium]|nr:hypothetical protein [Chloroflexota bacterium]